MKAKNILMSILLVTGFIAAKAAGYPPELALVSQPMMTYHADHITVYYDVENIGDYTYRGSVCLYLYPDEGYSYAEKWVKVRPGRIKRIAIDIPAYRIRRGHPFTIMPYYEMGDELYSFTTFEYFEPITFFWEGPRNERWVVINIGPCPSYYHRPGHYRYYYDGFRPPMPPAGHGPRPMDPKHHTYGYHHNNGGYPGSHEVAPAPNSGSTEAPTATVRPKANGGSMSSGSSNSGASTGSATTGSSSSGRVSGSTSSSSSRPAATTSSSTSGRVSSSTSSSGRTGNSSSSGRVSSSTSSSNSRPAATTSSSSSSKRSSASTGSATRSGSSSSSASSRTSGSSASGRR